MKRWLFAALATVGCASLVHVSRSAQLSQGEAVVYGIYEEIDVRENPTPPAVYRGHAVVRLSDGTAVYLDAPWTEGAIRSHEERIEFNGKYVKARGTLHPECPAAPSGSRPVACLSPVGSISHHR